MSRRGGRWEPRAGQGYSERGVGALDTGLGDLLTFVVYRGIAASACKRAECTWETCRALSAAGLAYVTPAMRHYTRQLIPAIDTAAPTLLVPQLLLAVEHCSRWAPGEPTARASQPSGVQHPDPAADAPTLAGHAAFAAAFAAAAAQAPSKRHCCYPPSLSPAAWTTLRRMPPASCCRCCSSACC